MTYHLARSVRDVDEFFAQESEDFFFGADTEATSLNTRRAKLVGYSVSFQEGEAMYVPVGHKIGNNIPFEPAIEAFTRRCQPYQKGGETVRQVPVFYNAKYDVNILQANAKWAPDKYEDGLEAVYMENPDRKEKNLKSVAFNFCGMEMEKFEELFTDEERKAKILDISTKTPERCTDYGSADSDAVLRVWRHPLIVGVRQDQKFAIGVDTELIDTVRKMEHNGGMELNHEYIEEQIQKLEARAEALREQIQRMLGFTFNVDSPKSLGIALFERGGIPSPGMTAGRNPFHRTDADTMEKLAKTHPIVELVITYRKVVKAKNSYFAKLQRLDRLKVPVRFSFNMFAAPTFRFAAPGGDPLKDGFSGINIQAVSAGESRNMMGVDLSEEGLSLDKDIDEGEILFKRDVIPEDVDDETPIEEGWEDPERMATLPWVVEFGDHKKLACFRDICSGCPARCAKKGIDTTRRMLKDLRMMPSVRQSFKVPDGWTLVSFDYDRQEIVIGANMSREPRWLTALKNKEDLHARTASFAFGVPYEKFLKAPGYVVPFDLYQKRGIAKTLNFAVFYGATAYTLAMKADISKQQAEQIYDGFVKGHPVLFSWIEKVHIFARKNKYTTTYLGRKRSLAHIYDHPDPKMKAFGDRSAVNTAVQGTAAEVTRIAMVRTARKLRDYGVGQKEIRPVQQVHDELSYMIRTPLVSELAPIIQDGMQFNVKGWEVQLTCSPKVGTIWGKQDELSMEELQERFRLAA